MKSVLLHILSAIIAVLVLGGTASAQTVADTASQATSPQSRLWSSQPNVIQGKGIESGSSWVLGEIRNDGSAPTYRVRVTARLVAESGSVVASASQFFPYLGAGDTIGYRIELRAQAAGNRVELSLDSADTGYANYVRLPVNWDKNEQVADSQSHVRYLFTGSVAGNAGPATSLNAVYVWFLDDQDRVVWMDYAYLPNAISSGSSASFSIRTLRDTENPSIPSISKVRYYAMGQLGWQGPWTHAGGRAGPHFLPFFRKLKGPTSLLPADHWSQVSSYAQKLQQAPFSGACRNGERCNPAGHGRPYLNCPMA
ncbi:MAG TPA: hypothetical protein VHS28_05460 [Chloroflexota bacterium]|nr:hypothetical protein [Chloroflexota bacterium]